MENDPNDNRDSWLALWVALKGAAIGALVGLAIVAILSAVGFILSFVVWSHHVHTLYYSIVGDLTFIGLLAGFGGVSGFLIGLLMEWRIARRKRRDHENR